MKWLALAVVVGSVAACSGGSDGNAPTSPTAASTPADISGSYDLTLTASSSCAANLPAETRVLKYVANVTQTGGSLQVQLLAHVIWNTVAVSGSINGPNISFTAFSFSEITTAGGIALHATGTATVAANGSIAGSLIGAYQGPSGASCDSNNHQIQMVRRVV